LPARCSVLSLSRMRISSPGAATSALAAAQRARSMSPSVSRADHGDHPGDVWRLLLLLDRSVNRSFGAQIDHAIRRANLSPETLVRLLC